MDRDESAPLLPQAPQITGQQFGRFLLLRRLGAGGMAEVYLAREPLPGGLHKLLVLKKIRPAYASSPAFLRMFEEEAKIGVNLNHPCVVQTFGYGHIGDVFYLMMEHVDGIDLLRLLHLTRGQGLLVPPALAAYILCQVCQGLDYAHRKTDDEDEPLAIVHRDVSPQNVLLSWDGAVKLADFGIARARDTREDDGLLKGKYAYMSPEQAAGAPVDRRSDLYSAGVVLWETVTGQALYGALPMREALDAIRRGRTPRPSEVCPSVPPALEEIILRALKLSPEERYQTARDLHRDLSRFYFGDSTRRGEVVDSGRLAAFMARLVPPKQRPMLMAGVAETGGSSGAQTGPKRSPIESGEALRERLGVYIIEGRFPTTPAPDNKEFITSFIERATAAAQQKQALAERIDERGFTLLFGLPHKEEHDAEQALQLALQLLETGGPSLAVAVYRGTAVRQRSMSGAAASARGPAFELPSSTREAALGLLDVARPGEIVVDSAVYRSVRESFHFLAIETQVPVHPTPGRAYRLLSSALRWEPAATSPRIVGRGSELAFIHEALGAAALGRPQRVLIIGDAGIGKRTLLSAFRTSLDPARYLVLHAAVPSSQRGISLALLADLARDLLGVSEHADSAEIERHLEAAARILADGAGKRRQLDALRLLLNAPQGSAAAAGDAIRELIQGLRARRRLVLTVAELQWADVSSLTIAEQLVSDGDLDLCVYTGRRPIEWPEDLRTLLGREPAPSLLELRGLLPAEQQELILSRLHPDDHIATRPLCGQLIDLADGNPFFLGELLNALLDRGALRADSGGLLRLVDASIDPGVPPTLEAAIAARLDRLPERQHQCLIFLSVCLQGAGRVDLGLLSSLLAYDPAPELLGLVEAGLVLRSGDDGWSIRSKLVREVAASSLDPADRRRMQEQLLLLLAGDVQTHVARTDIARSVRAP